MDSADANYDSLAEVHVPSYCDNHADYHKGCMFPGADNFDATALQSGKCQFKLIGCMNSEALNYNSEATNHDDAMCIYPKWGCTIASEGYDGGRNGQIFDPNTPGFQGLTIDFNFRAIGKWVYSEYQAVTNYNSSADSMHTVYGDRECIIVREGCMDNTAINYDPKANQDTGDWCIAEVEGCMMPTETNANEDYNHHITGQQHQKDGLADYSSTGYDSRVTKHVKSTCTLHKEGCMDPTKPNFDSRATVDDGSCLPYVEGCLHPEAYNFGCTTNTTEGTTHDQDLFWVVELANVSDPNAPNNTIYGQLKILPCDLEEKLSITVHNPLWCNFYLLQREQKEEVNLGAIVGGAVGGAVGAVPIARWLNWD